MTSINKKNLTPIPGCTSDNDCKNNTICAFNDEDLNNYCVSNDVNDLYYGCVNDDNISKLESIESKSTNEHSNYMKCIDFSRRQLNKDGLEHNYVIFKPKKSVFVDTTTLNIYLKCEDEILAIIPYNDYFNLKCDEYRENCTMESKDSLLNFIIQNSKNCSKKLYLEIIYECENEGLKKHEKIPIHIDNFTPIKIKLTCPININNDKFKSKCESIYIDKYEMNNLADNKKSLYDCKNPLYTVPRIVNNVNNYKKLKVKHANIELKDYDNKINEKISDLKKLEVEKYIKMKKIQTGEVISFDDAYKIVNSRALDNLVSNPKNNWKIYNNYDAAQNLFNANESNKNKILTYYGLVYTIDDAINIANQNDQSYFVWYHNSYELDNFASKLYFIDIYNIDEELLKKSNWVKNDNVSTGMLKIKFDHVLYGEDDDDNDDNQNNKLTEKFDAVVSDTELMQKKMNDLINNNILNTKNINNSVMKQLDNKITTYGQMITMNNYETKINDNILTGLYIAFFFMFLIFMVVIVYFNNKTAGKIQLFGV